MRPLLLLDTGGTIGTKRSASGTLDHSVTSPSTQLLIEEARRGDFLVELVGPKDIFDDDPSGRDSSRIGPAQWARISSTITERVDQYEGVILLHGTDTLSYTASALSFALRDIAVPVVLTAAQRSAAEANSDAPDNIRLALDAVAGRFGDLAGEIVIAFGGRLLRGNRSTKISVNGSRGFATPGFPELAADLSANLEPSKIWRNSRSMVRLQQSSRFNPNIWIVDMWPGLTRDTLERALAAVQPEGLIFRLFGVGTAPLDVDLPRLASSLARSTIPMLAVSAVPGGPLDWHRYESTAPLLATTLLNGVDMTLEAATTKLMWVLANASDPAARSALLLANVAGEKKSPT